MFRQQLFVLVALRIVHGQIGRGSKIIAFAPPDFEENLIAFGFGAGVGEGGVGVGEFFAGVGVFGIGAFGVGFGSFLASGRLPGLPRRIFNFVGVGAGPRFIRSTLS